MKLIDLVRKVFRGFSRFYLRKRLKNNNFSIICNNCIGGVIYHELGMQFLSPTINLWMPDKDFYKFVNNIHYYIGVKLKFIKIDGETTPVAKLDDITIHFNHYHSEREAEEKWISRCKRINWDNLFIICSDRPNGENLITDKDILSLKNINCKGKVVFAVRDIRDVDYIVHLPKDPNCPIDKPYVNAYMFDKTSFLLRWRWELIFDYVNWLNNGKVY